MVQSHWKRLFTRSPETIRDFLAAAVGASDLPDFTASSKELPGFRFPDICVAAEWYSALAGKIAELRSEHDSTDLNTLIHDLTSTWVPRAIKQSKTIAWAINANEERQLAVDQFWIAQSATPTAGKLILRLSFNPYTMKARLEAASRDEASAGIALETILNRSVSHSIYRGSVLELAFATGTKDEYGDVEKPDQLRVLFKPFDPIDDGDIVIDDQVRRILMRNIIDLHHRREVLKANGVPIRRGVLLYGPPGTGKTFACRYAFSKLPGVTRIAVTGTALTQVSHIFNLARLYQPSLVLLEDVDLVFASREINLYSSVLGELLDQMDGLRPHEDIGILLTTNSIERMEAAIRDRPGRVGQCVYIGPPAVELRHRYLLRYLQAYEIGDVDVDELVAMSEEATQAFLKEWVHRAVQIVTERLDGPDARARLVTADFREAFDEMRRFSEGSTGRIIGFLRPG